MDDVLAVFEDFDLSKYLVPKLKSSQIFRYDVDEGDFHWLKNEIMRRLGYDGWELCGVLGIGRSEILYFKREINSGTKNPEEARLSREY